MIQTAIAIREKPIVSYWKCGDIDLSMLALKQKLTAINIITTKTLSDEFIDFVSTHKQQVYLHVIISGMAGTAFEPKIPTVRTMFVQMIKLIKVFPKKQILVVIDPVVPNGNGLEAIKLLLRLFSEYNLKLTYMRFNQLSYAAISDQNNKQTFVISNRNIQKRLNNDIRKFVERDQAFFREYYVLIGKYRNIIHVDNGMESLIGVRELLPFGYRNEWIDNNNNRSKLIEYIDNNRNKPDVNIISDNKRCQLGCILCPFKD